MPSGSTTNLNLSKSLFPADDNETFNFDVDLNQNWDKIDAVVGAKVNKSGDTINAKIGISQLSCNALRVFGVQKGSILCGSTTNALGVITPPSVSDNVQRFLGQLNGVSSFSVPTGSALQAFLAANGTTGNQVVNISQFANSQLFNGYQKLPSSLIIQWGTFTVSGSYYVDTSVIFPITFPNAVSIIIGASQSANAAIFRSISNTLSGAVIRIEDKASTALPSTKAFWLAIGN